MRWSLSSDTDSYPPVKRLDDCSQLSRLEWILLVMCVLVPAVLPWTVEYWPSQDGPNHLAAAHILEHYNSPGAGYSDCMALELSAPASGYSLAPSNFQYVLLLALNNIASLPAAMKLLASFAVIALAFSIILLILGTVPERIRSIFLVLPLLPGWALGMGFVRYLLACAFGLLAIAVASGNRGGRRSEDWAPSLKRLLLAGGCFFLCAWSHPFVPLLIGFAQIIIEAKALRKPEAWRNLAIVAAPGALLVVVYAILGNGHSSAGSSEVMWADLGSALLGLLYYHTSYSMVEWLPLGIALAGMYIFFIRGFFTKSLRSGSFERRLRYAVLLLHLLYFILPVVLFDWWYCSARALILGVYLLPCVVVLPGKLDRPMGTALAGFILVVSIFTIQARQVSEFSAEIENVVRMEESVPAGIRLLPICGYSTEFANPLHHAWAYLVLTRDIVSPYFSAAGKPKTGGIVFRMLRYKPGVLEESGSLPWIDESEVRRECSVSDARCSQTLESLMPIVRKYDRVLLVRPSARLLEAVRSRLTLQRQEGNVYLFSMPR